MYRCKECYTEYENQVDYCDCGNNTFEFIENTNKYPKKNFSIENKLQIISWMFFTLCLILAILVWFIPIVDNEEKTDTKKTPKQTISKTIPDITKIWNDTPKQLQTKKTETTPKVSTNITKQLTDKISKPKETKPKATTAPEKNIKKEVTKTPIPQNTLNAITKPTPKTTQTNKNLTTQQNLVQQPKKIEKPIYNPNSPAMIEYKTKLRAALFAKFAVGSVQGSGSCSISFSIDKTGKLINRKFIKESDNKTLNDTVYYMLMSLPYYSIPPAEYNGETIRMEFSIFNGNYEISIN